jgi:ribosomal protein S18 acetylase RimI-like enzyme
MRAEGPSEPALNLRPMRWPEDEVLLQEVYASTRADELAQVPWSDEQKRTFCQMQFAAQHQYYQEHYAGATFDLIEQGGIPVGRIYVARWPSEMRIVDIALLPAHRGRGIGTKLLRDLQDEARAAGRLLSIHVEKFNPALALYQRLGFQVVADRGAYLFLEWTANSA